VTPAQARFQRDLALLLNDTDDLLCTVGSQSLASGFARDLLVLAEVGNGSLRLPGINSRVERGHGDALAIGPFDG
jgi:hypothetical protein